MSCVFLMALTTSVSITVMLLLLFAFSLHSGTQAIDSEFPPDLVSTCSRCFSNPVNPLSEGLAHPASNDCHVAL